MKELSPLEINNIIEHEKMRSFIELVSNGPRPDGTYNYCREALQKKAKELLEELHKEKQRLTEVLYQNMIMTTVPDIKDLKRIDEYDSLTQLMILKDICNAMYIARNITMSQDSMFDNLEKIDRLFRDENYN